MYNNLKLITNYLRNMIVLLRLYADSPNILGESAFSITCSNQNNESNCVVKVMCMRWKSDDSRD